MNENRREVRREEFQDGSAIVIYEDGSALIVESRLANGAALREERRVNYNDPPPPPEHRKQTVPPIAGSKPPWCDPPATPERMQG